MVRKNDGTMVPISEYMDSPEAWERPTVSEMKQAMALCAGLGFCEVCGQPIGCPPLIECPAAHNHVWDEPTEVETSQE